MTISESGPLAAGAAVNGFAPGDGAAYYRTIDKVQQAKIQSAGRRFVELTDGSDCLVLIGQLVGGGDPGKPTDQAVQDLCEKRFGFPPPSPPRRTISVILDSTGGPLDSAFKTVLYLSRYSDNINVYVPRRAKSASTLIAVGAHGIYMSPFGELGPLDTQIRDPRNPTDYISALDCYQSVDYVRDFGFGTLAQAIKHLAMVTQGKITLIDSLGAATQFAIGSITPMLSQTKSLDFGAWGRSLKIGEKYAQILLARVDPLDKARAKRIASRLVYGYTHHLFAIDIAEAKDIGLNPKEMSNEQYKAAVEIVNTCDRNEICIEFIKETDEPEESDERPDAAAVTGAPVEVAP